MLIPSGAESTHTLQGVYRGFCFGRMHKKKGAMSRNSASSLSFSLRILVALSAEELLSVLDYYSLVSVAYANAVKVVARTLNIEL